MLNVDMRGVLRVTARAVIAGAITLGAVQGAAADDAGLHGFFSAMFGGGDAEPQQAPAAVTPSIPSASVPVDYRRPVRSHPLTVRLHKQAPRLVVTREAPSKPVKVSIYQDKTLRRGDAVMTATGIRIFAGSSSWPYAPQDFVSLNDAGRLGQDTSKVLAELDRAPRG